jgi:hypothetical protein
MNIHSNTFKLFPSQVCQQQELEDTLFQAKKIKIFLIQKWRTTKCDWIKCIKELHLFNYFAFPNDMSWNSSPAYISIPGLLFFFSLIFSHNLIYLQLLSWNPGQLKDGYVPKKVCKINEWINFVGYVLCSTFKIHLESAFYSYHHNPFSTVFKENSRF